jgi:hypothetical protein
MQTHVTLSFRVEATTLHCTYSWSAGHLQFLEMEGGADDPPVLGPFLAVVASQPVVQPPLQAAELDLLEVAELVGENFSHQLGLGDGHPGHRPEPGDGRFTCHCRSMFSCSSVG